MQALMIGAGRPSVMLLCYAVLCCEQASNSGHPRWTELCDPTSSTFAQTPLIMDTDNQTVLALTGAGCCLCAATWWLTHTHIHKHCVALAVSLLRVG